MLGLSIGSWAGGRFIAPISGRTRFSPLMFYAVAELLIGVSAYAVPRLFSLGEHLLLLPYESDSLKYLFLSAMVLAICILPWCIFMGATFPFMMAYMRKGQLGDKDSFSYLYVANVLGAMCGTFLTAVVFIEMLGFRGTLQCAACGNFMIALCSFLLGIRGKREINQGSKEAADQPVVNGSPSGLVKWILFSTGFCAMAMEVVWTRLFTPVLKTQVYSFALIVFVYLGATLVGSLVYRRHLKRGKTWQVPTLIALLVVAAFLPVPASDPRFVHMDILFAIHGTSVLIVMASIFPICAILGYLTPSLIDESCRGNPAEAGKAYAINVVGCIIGPLVASYLLLPAMSEQWSILVLTVPLLVFYFFLWKPLPSSQRLWSGLAGGVLVIYCLFLSRSFADSFAASSSHVEVRRDYTASVISADPDGDKKLLVNGVGMTTLTPITKFMIHLPMALHTGPPESVLVVCFGMGTSYRSALSWDVETTAVELVPSVPKALGFYHADAAEVLKNPKGHIVIDDGRRFLMRTPKQFDVIAIDPPPPLQAAGSSLLYSTGFYDLIKQHLKPNGIVQVWLPAGDKMTDLAAMRSVYSSFPHVRCFPSVVPGGVHILASMEPMEQRTPAELEARMSASAKKDLLEWAPGIDVVSYLNKVMSREVPVEELLNPNPDLRITDDDPFNEYYLLRQNGLF